MRTTTTKRFTKALALAACLGLAGCSSAYGFVANTLGLPVQPKTVMSKRDPNELIAVDGTTCIVSSGRYEEVEISERVSCFWSESRASDP